MGKHLQEEHYLLYLLYVGHGRTLGKRPGRFETEKSYYHEIITDLL